MTVKRPNPIPGNKPFKKGQSGNPKGRPKQLPELKELLADVLSEEKDGRTAAFAILAALRVKAAKGDVRAAQLLLDRAYGQVKGQLDVTSGDKPLMPGVIRVELVGADVNPE